MTLSIIVTISIGLGFSYLLSLTTPKITPQQMREVDNILQCEQEKKSILLQDISNQETLMQCQKDLLDALTKLIN